MASQRLRQFERDNIVKRLMVHKFQARAHELVLAHRKLADAIYHDVFSEEDQRLMASIPKGWLPTSNLVRVEFAGTVDVLYHDNSHVLENTALNHLVDHDSLKVSDERLIPYYCNNRVIKVYEALHPLAEIHADYERLRKALTAEVSAARAQVYAALNAHSTVNKLLNEWPEIAPFVNQKGNAPAHPVPAIPVTQLNTLLDLPV